MYVSSFLRLLHGFLISCMPHSCFPQMNIKLKQAPEALCPYSAEDLRPRSKGNVPREQIFPPCLKPSSPAQYEAVTASKDSARFLWWLQDNKSVRYSPTEHLLQSFPKDILATVGFHNSFFLHLKSEDDKCYFALIKVFLQSTCPSQSNSAGK